MSSVTLMNVVANKKGWLRYNWVKLLTKRTRATYIWHHCQEVCKIITILMTNTVLVKSQRSLAKLLLSNVTRCDMDIGHCIWPNMNGLQGWAITFTGVTGSIYFASPLNGFTDVDTESGLIVCVEENLANFSSVSHWRLTT